MSSFTRWGQSTYKPCPCHLHLCKGGVVCFLNCIKVITAFSLPPFWDRLATLGAQGGCSESFREPTGLPVAWAHQSNDYPTPPTPPPQTSGLEVTLSDFSFSSDYLAVWQQLETPHLEVRLLGCGLLLLCWISPAVPIPVVNTFMPCGARCFSETVPALKCIMGHLDAVAWPHTWPGRTVCN